MSAHVTVLSWALFPADAEVQEDTIITKELDLCQILLLDIKLMQRCIVQPRATMDKERIRLSWNMTTL